MVFAACEVGVMTFMLWVVADSSRSSALYALSVLMQQSPVLVVSQKSVPDAVGPFNRCHAYICAFIFLPNPLSYFHSPAMAYVMTEC